MNARARLIKPDFFFDEALATVDMQTRLFYVGLWTVADRDGRLEDRPQRLKAQVFPYDDGDPEAMLAALARIGVIRRYQADGKLVVQIVSFSKHQRPNPHEKPSDLPPPPTESNLDQPRFSPRCEMTRPVLSEAEAEAEAEAKRETASRSPARTRDLSTHGARGANGKSGHQHHAVVAAFCDGWKRVYGASYTPASTEMANLKTLLASLPESDRDDVPRWVENYLADQSKFLVESMRHSLAHFVTHGNWNKYRVRAKVATTVAEKNALFFAQAEARLAASRGGSP